jgi:hypothetical protein
VPGNCRSLVISCQKDLLGIKSYQCHSVVSCREGFFSERRLIHSVGQSKQTVERGFAWQ